MNILNITENELNDIFNKRMNNHIQLVNDFYYKITGKMLYNHDADKFDNPIWKYYYYCREKNIKLPDELYFIWKYADEQHRLNSHHHIECLLNNNELDWDELVSDFLQLIENIINH